MIAAAADRKAVTFTYNDTPRTVEPWRLSFTRGHWYLAGWDRTRDDERLYRVDRITGSGRGRRRCDRGRRRGRATPPTSAAGSSATATPSAPSSASTPTRPPTPATSSARSEELDDGGVVAELAVRNEEAFRSFVLSFLDHAEVLEPAELRDGMIQLARGPMGHGMSAKLTARERLTRLLAVIPWVVEQDGAPLDEIAARFDYPRNQLVDDLTQVVLFVGVHPFTPDSLIEVDITDDRV